MQARIINDETLLQIQHLRVEYAQQHRSLKAHSVLYSFRVTFNAPVLALHAEHVEEVA